MLKIATTLMVICLIVFLASLAFTAYRFAATETITTAGTVIMFTSAVLTCFAIFVRSRAIAGIRIFEITDKDKAELQEARRELGIRRILAKLAVGFGGICFLGSFATLSQNLADWRISVEMFVIGGFLLLCTVLLSRDSK